MGSIPKAKRLPSGAWRIQFEKFGVRESATRPTAGEVTAWAVDRIRELEEAHRSGVKAHTLEEALDEYAIKVSPNKASKERERWEIGQLKAFKRYLKPWLKWKLDDITELQLAEFRDDRLETVEPSTFYRDVSLLKGVFTVAREEWRWMAPTHNPWKRLKMPKNNEPRTRRPTVSEIKRICRWLGYKAIGPIEDKGAQVAAAFLLACRTACRSRELLQLERRDFNWREMTICMRAETTKSRKYRETLIDNGAERLIRRLAAGNPEWKSDKRDRLFSVANATRVNYFCQAVIELGIEDLHFHDSRAEALTRLSRHYDVMDLAEMSGHANISFLKKVYYRKKVAEMVKKVRRKPSDDHVPAPL